MSDIAIKFENISKQYRLGMIGTGTLSHDLNRWWAMNIRGKEDPNLKIGQVNDRAAKSTEDYVWALQNIDFEVKQGEVLGIIGKNGAGKSTLLKILSRVTNPTTGRITANGRIASLLEVGTGFHPEMTGRENIYMNGSIMGMRKTEITRKLDEIVDFAGVEKYIDTPVKRYSSGMTVRLGFAIAANLEPEILVVDEVLAVGDAEFQKKAIGKMQDVSKGDGRTVLFVSHNMNSISRLCEKGIILKNGGIIFQGSADDSITEYINKHTVSDDLKTSFYPDINSQNGKDIVLIKAELRNQAGNLLENVIDVREKFSIYIKLKLNTNVNSPKITFHFKNKFDDFVWFCDINDTSTILPLNKGIYEYQINVPQPLLKPDTYHLYIGIVNQSNLQTNHFPNILKIELIDLFGIRADRAGYLYTETVWHLLNNNKEQNENNC